MKLPGNSTEDNGIFICFPVIKKKSRVSGMTITNVIYIKNIKYKFILKYYNRIVYRYIVVGCIIPACGAPSPWGRFYMKHQTGVRVEGYGGVK